MSENVSVKEFNDAVGLLEDLQTENEQLVGNSRKLNTWYTELYEAFSVLKQQYVKLQQERDEVEQQYQHLCDGWRQELEQKQAAFDSARSSILSQRDVELLRAHITQEAEKPLKAQCEAFRQDAENARSELAVLTSAKEAEKSEKDAKILHLQLALQRFQAQASAQKTQDQAHEDSGQGVLHTPPTSSARQQLRHSERSHHAAETPRESWRAREAQLLADNESLASKYQHVTAEIHELKAACLAKELQHKGETTELELKASQASAAELKTKHQLCLAREKLTVMEDEIRQLSDSNSRLAGQCNSVQVEASRASQKLHISEQELSAKLRVLEDRVAAAHDIFKRQIDEQVSEVMKFEQSCDNSIKRMEAQMEDVQDEIQAKMGSDRGIPAENGRTQQDGECIGAVHQPPSRHQSVQTDGHTNVDLKEQNLQTFSSHESGGTHDDGSQAVLHTVPDKDPATGDTLALRPKHWMQTTLKALVVAHQMHAALRDAENAYQHAATENAALKSSGPLVACSNTLTESRNQRWVALKRRLHALQERQEVYLTGNRPSQIMQPDCQDT